MSMSEKKAILAVSFGTSWKETRQKTIEQIEADLQAAFPDRSLCRAWTSGMIIRKVQKEEGLQVDTPQEALERMSADGVRDVLVQPTHMLDGYENQRLKGLLAEYTARFDQIRLAQPLLTSQEDLEETARALIEVCETARQSEPDIDAMLLMGHGTPEHLPVGQAGPSDPNAVYHALQEVFDRLTGSRESGNTESVKPGSGKADDAAAESENPEKNEAGPARAAVYVATVEGTPSFEEAEAAILRSGARHVLLAPLMVVAGDHAHNDLAGEDEDSWKSRLESAGCRTTVIDAGLGELPAIRRLYVAHARRAERGQETANAGKSMPGCKMADAAERERESTADEHDAAPMNRTGERV